MIKNEIVLGSCLNGGMKNIPDKSVKLVLTDPPYGMSFKSNNRKNKIIDIQNDDSLDFLPEYIGECKRILTDDGSLVCFGPSRFELIREFVAVIEKEFKKVPQQIIWHKANSGMGDLKGGFAPCYENILFVGNKNFAFSSSEKRPPNVLTFPQKTMPEDFGHPTSKDIDLLRYLVRLTTNKGDVVFDGFMGSGSSAVAAKMEDRDYYGFEIEPVYHDNSIKRLSMTDTTNDGGRLLKGMLKLPTDQDDLNTELFE